MRVSIVNKIGGSPVVDNEGAEAILKVDLSAVATQTRITGWLRTIKYPDQLYLRINVTAPTDNGTSVYIDDLMIKKGVELYRGGPLVNAYAGRRTVEEGDTYTINATNDRAGEWSTWLERVFSLAANNLQIPTTGTTLINDNLIG